MDLRNSIGLRVLLLLLTFPLIFVPSGCSGGGSAVTSPVTPPVTPPVTTPANSCTTANASITHTSSTANSSQLVVLDTKKYPQAVCNDGSAAAYILRPGVGAAATRWVIALQGGGECYDQASCSSRAAGKPQLIGTSLYQSGTLAPPGQAGLESPLPSTNPDFFDATTVRALYCSSDDWSGAKAGTGAFSTGNPATWNFQGKAILNAILADLNASRGLSSATEVLLTGESAGGVGVFANVNSVAKLIPTTARYVAHSDAAYYNAVQNFSSSGAAPNYTDPVATANQLTERSLAIPLTNGTGDSVCAAAAGTSASITAQIGCYNAQQLLGSGGTITLPMFVSEAQRDTNQLGTDGVGNISGSLTSAQNGYISYFAASMRTGLALSNAQVSIFSPNALIHTESDDSTLFTTPYAFPNASSLTLQQAIGAWYKAPCTPQRNIAN